MPTDVEAVDIILGGIQGPPGPTGPPGPPIDPSTILIVQEGIHIIESLFLEELAGDGVREFGFVCLPLKLKGGTGSPVNPIATF